ncbi:PREDICTED: ATP-binding cassette sub-family A member 3 [Drosophila arizonae]|uniref:ATP-binding cassette sub-family A member 3 n=1 Tax=Drosophila arizonae TaxID=7263 RepID=A0ABM1PQ23_DROAR|nr:PREDICTED: ATP-binding cassette sub-family A member 3 [Drosophila arizonae]
MEKVSSWTKFKLLLWKNWVLQWSHKIQLFVELLLPIVFCLLLILVRIAVHVSEEGVSNYKVQRIDSLELFKYEVNSEWSHRFKMFVSLASKKSKSVNSLSGNARPNFVLVFAPQNAVLVDLMAKVATRLNMSVEGIDSIDNIESNVVGRNAFAGVVFHGSKFDELPDNLEYTLRFPSELRTVKFGSATWLTKRLYPVLSPPGPRNPESDDGGIPPGYLREGFLPIQNAISMSYIQLKSSGKTLPDVVMQRYPYPAYTNDKLIGAFHDVISLIILLSFIYPCTCITRYISKEKEMQLKEVMKIMGLDNWLHWSAWFIKSFCMLTISVVLMVALMQIRFSENVAVLTQSNFFAVLLFFLVYTTNTICFCFMMSTLFAKASTAAAVTGLVWFIFYMPYMLTIPTYGGLSLSDKLGWSMCLNTAMGFGIMLIVSFEASGEGLQWYNLFSPVNIDDNLTVGYVMIMMLVSSVVYMLVCLYIEQIFAGSYGVTREWYFPFTKSFWCQAKKVTHPEDMPELEQQDPNAFESEPTDKLIGLQIRNLQKKFQNKWAVKGISLNMYEDNITVLLGHNGAGKTTTISMLTGMLPPTSGTAIINGSDIRTNTKGARESLGVCPQHNVLFNDMTVENHLRFFCRLKGLKGQAVDAEVKKYLQMINLEKKANNLAETLSGGMKRKLSLCCALCGGTKVVLCDEPSSGMDPAARRQLWDLLISERPGRTILLTTHFMDEADVLGDRIAIMCGGELKCNGTSFFLKKKFGSGHQLILVKKDNCHPAEVTAVLSKYIPNIRPTSDIGTELTYSLPDKYSSKFEELFRELEKRKDELNLDGFGVGNTSLEEVFMKVGAESMPNGEAVEPKSKAIPLASNPDNESMKSDTYLAQSAQMLDGMKLTGNQWAAMLYKKMLYTYRNKVLFLVQNLLPILFVALTIMVSRSGGTNADLPAIELDLTQYPVAVSVMEALPGPPGSSQGALIAKSYKQLATSYGPAYTLETTGNQSFSDYILELGKTIQLRINARYLVGATIGENSITTWLNNQLLHTAPLTLNMVHNAIARALIGENVRIRVTNSPLPFKTETLLVRSQTGAGLGTQLASNIVFCMCFVSTLYILFLINERESRSQLLQFVSGVKGWIFWMSHFIWDILTFAVTAFIATMTLACFQEENFSTVDQLGRIFLLMLIFGFAVLPFTYFLSYSFKDAATGFARIVILNIFAGMAIFAVVIIMSSELFESKTVANWLNNIFRIFPHFSLAMGIHKVSSNTATRAACDKLTGLPPIIICELVPMCCSVSDFFDWEPPGVLQEIVYMITVGFMLFICLLLNAYGISRKIISLLSKKPPMPPERTNVDDDVDKERRRILNWSQQEIAEKNLVLDRVCKYYGKFLAVNQVSLCVSEGECFGLLGVNGAGKTTTFKMLTGDTNISLGNVYVQGRDLQENINEIYKRIGYCPQFDAVLENLSGRELLKIFCLLRGIRRKNIKPLSEDLAMSFGFLKHLDKRTKAYSGGNKRKLSAAIAVLGSPAVVYMDEPTTGMDPAARRQLWNIVCRIRDSGTSIVLTSHSMEECEALCTRLAIMVNGELMCMGSTQQLKNKFSKGFILKIKMLPNLTAQKRGPLFNDGYSTPIPYDVRNVEMDSNLDSLRTSTASNEHVSPTPVPYKGSVADILPSTGNVIEIDNGMIAKQDNDKVKAFVQEKYPESVLQEECQGMLTFYIPLQGLKWSEIFGIIESHREELHVEDYSISQTTLEEIFLEFAKFQAADERHSK